MNVPDPEIEAMATVYEALQPFNQVEIDRMLDWALARIRAERKQRDLDQSKNEVSETEIAPRAMPVGEGRRDAAHHVGPETQSGPARGSNEEQIRYMVNRFLGWRLPRNFSPDAGISYTRPNYFASVDATPSGTNLFDVTQAEAMVRYMIEGMPVPGAASEASEQGNGK